MADTPPLTHAPHVFVDDLDAPVLDAGDRHHLDVLRIRPGAELVVCDGHGGWRTVEHGRELVVRSPIVRVEPPKPPLAIAFALTKGDKPELTVQKLTELGVDRIVVVEAERSVARWDTARAAKHLTRLRSVAREAAMQSRRVRLPVLEGVVGFAELARREPVVVADRDGLAPAVSGAAAALVAIGPEGGFTPAELALAAGRVTLGAHVLRAETAAIAAAALYAALRAPLVAPLAPPTADRGG